MSKRIKAFIQLDEILGDVWVESAKYYNYYLLYINISYSEDLCVEETWRIWSGSVCARTLKGFFSVYHNYR